MVVGLRLAEAEVAAVRHQEAVVHHLLEHGSPQPGLIPDARAEKVFDVARAKGRRGHGVRTDARERGIRDALLAGIGIGSRRTVCRGRSRTIVARDDGCLLRPDVSDEDGE